jgi:hypothetical protein
MAKRQPKPGYHCDTCGKTRRGAHTDVLRDADGSVKLSTSECPQCFVDGKSQKYTFEAHVDSYGFCEFITAKCPTHGPIKMLQTAQADPRYQANYFRWRTGGAMTAPPKQFKEV